MKLRQLLALAGKDLRLLFRDKSGAFVTFVFPFVYSVFFGLVLAGREDVSERPQTGSVAYTTESASTRSRMTPENRYAISFPQGVVWGVLGCCASFSISIATERTRGTWSRLRTMPLSPSSMLAGKALACLVSIGSVGCCVFVLGRIACGVRPQSPLLLLVSLLVMSLAFVGIMMLLSTAGRTERAASGISWAVLLAMAMLGGGMVPSVFMPPWMQGAAVVSPIKWGILAMEGAVWRGMTLQELLVPWSILLAVGAVSFLVGVRLLVRVEEE